MIHEPHAAPQPSPNPAHPLPSLEEEIDFIHHREALALQRTLTAAELQSYILPDPEAPLSHW